MRNLLWVGIVLIVLGIGGLVIQNVNFTQDKKVVDVGPLEIHKEEEHKVRIPTVVGIGAILAGLGLIVLSQRKQ